MIYGRRLFDKSLEGPLYKKPAHRVFKVVNSAFQWKYTLILMAFLGIALAIFLVPSWYFINQNYSIFNQLARSSEPGLTEHLEREVIWLIGFTVFSVASLLILTMWVGLKMTANIVGPLISMERHMWKVTSGDWSTDDFKIRAEDDFRDLAQAYSYLYRSLKAQAEAELKLLQSIHIGPEHRDAYNALHSLIRLKKQQMMIKETELKLIKNEDAAVSHGSRHAS